MVSLTVILNWFKKGLKPTQEQFSKTFMSFRHKEDKVPISDIDGVDDLLQSKADSEALENHINDEELHSNKQFTETTANKLRALVYVEAAASLIIDTSSFEKGVATDVKFTWSVLPNEDTINDVVFDGVSGLGNAGNQTFNTSTGITKLLVVKRDSGDDITKSITSSGYVPQYVGEITGSEPSYLYNDLQIFTKLIQSSTSLSFNGTLSNEKLFFLSTSGTKTPTDVETGNSFSLGDFNSTGSFFKMKEVSVKLSDGSDVKMYLYIVFENRNQSLNVYLK